MGLTPTGFSSILARRGPYAQGPAAQEPDAGKAAAPRPIPRTASATGARSLWVNIKDLWYYLKTGFRPDGDVAGGAVSGVIEDAAAHLSAADRAAIAAYLSSLSPIPRQ